MAGGGSQGVAKGHMRDAGTPQVKGASRWWGTRTTPPQPPTRSLGASLATPPAAQAPLGWGQCPGPLEQPRLPPPPPWEG